MASRIRKGDQVVLLKGKDKGKKGDVVKVFPDEGRVLVSGLNLAIHHEKPTQAKDGGKVSKEAAIHISNVSLLDPSTFKPTRVGFKFLDGKKMRYAKKSGGVLNG